MATTDLESFTWLGKVRRVMRAQDRLSVILSTKLATSITNDNFKSNIR